MLWQSFILEEYLKAFTIENTSIQMAMTSASPVTMPLEDRFFFSLMRLSITGFYKMLSYSVINLKLLQNIFLSSLIKETACFFFFFLLEQDGDPTWLLLPWGSCQLQEVLVCVFSQMERQGKEVGFFHHVKYFFKRKTTFCLQQPEELWGLFVTCGSKSKLLCWPLADLQCFLIRESYQPSYVQEQYCGQVT